MLKNINDSSISGLGPGETKIWYGKRSRDLMMGYDWCKKYNCLPSIANLTNSHVLLGSIACRELEEILHLLQGEVWSPNGEARELIQSSGLHHTSISVGDIIEIDGDHYMVDVFGFKKLGEML